MQQPSLATGSAGPARNKCNALETGELLLTLGLYLWQRHQYSIKDM